MNQGVAGVGGHALAAGEVEIVVDHHLDEPREIDFRTPAKPVAGLGGVGYQVIDFGGLKIAGVDIEMLFRVEFSAGESAGSRKPSLTEFRST